MIAPLSTRHNRYAHRIRESATIRSPRSNLRVAAVAVVVLTGLLPACTKSRPPDLTVLSESSEQISFEVPIESALFSKTRAPSQAEVQQAAQAHCAKYRRKAVWVRVIQRSTNMQNVTYDCRDP